MKRRTLGVVVALIAMILPLVAAPEAQQPRPGPAVRIGRLSPLSAAADVAFMTAFRQGLQDHGWIDGEHYTLESRFADGRDDQLPALAADLVRQRVNLILTGSNPGALAAKRTTSSIPIIMITTGDPVGAGIVSSLARPGANVTGITSLGQTLTAKRLELMKEVVPGVGRVAVLTRRDSTYTRAFMDERDGMARSFGLQLPVLLARDPDELDRAFQTMPAERPGALMVLSDPLFITHRRRIVELVGRARLPTIYFERSFVDAGGLLFYGASLTQMYREAAVYADKILKGARPGDLPIEQPTTLELAVNLKTARALGLTIPPSVLARADHVVP